MKISDFVDENGNIKVSDDMSEDLKNKINIINEKNFIAKTETDDDDDEEFDDEFDEPNTNIEELADEELNESELEDLNSLF